MKPNYFFKDLFWLILLNFLIKPVWILFIDRQVQNEIGFTVYGSYFAVFNLSVVFSFLTDMGMTSMYSQRLSSKIFTNISLAILRAKLLLALVYAAVMIFIAWLFALERWDIILPVILIQILTSFFLFFRGIVTANQHFKADAWLSILDKTLVILIGGSFIYFPFIFGRISLEIFLLVQVFSLLFSLMVIMIFLNSRYKTLKDDFSFKTIFKKSAPFTLIILLMSIHYRIDGFLLERLHPDGAYEAGIYASAYRLLDAANLLGYLAASFIVPFTARNQKNALLIKDTIGWVYYLLMIAAFAVVAFAWNFGVGLELSLYHSGNNYHVLVMQLCFSSLPAYFLIHIYGSLFTATNSLTLFIRLLIICVIINILLNTILIPYFGAVGSCIAALCSQYFCAVLLGINSKKVLNLSFEREWLFKSLFYGGLFFGFLYFISQYNMPLFVVIGLCAMLVAAFLMIQKAYFRKYILPIY